MILLNTRNPLELMQVVSTMQQKDSAKESMGKLTALFMTGDLGKHEMSVKEEFVLSDSKGRTVIYYDVSLRIDNMPKEATDEDRPVGEATVGEDGDSFLPGADLWGREGVAGRATEGEVD